MLEFIHILFQSFLFPLNILLHFLQFTIYKFLSFLQTLNIIFGSQHFNTLDLIKVDMQSQ